MAGWPMLPPAMLAVSLWAPEDFQRQRFEVLHDSREVEFVTGARKAAKPHTLDAVMSLDMRKPNLHGFSLVS